MPRRSVVQLVFTGYSGSVEQTRLGRRPAPRLPGSFRRGIFLIEVGENLLDHHRIVDAGDDPHRPAAFTAGLDVDIEHPLETSPPGAYFWCAQFIDARRSAGVCSWPASVALGFFPLPRLAGVTAARCLLFGANTP